jgi:hypothetical protein
MPARWLCISLVAAASCVAVGASEIASVPALRGGSLERGIVGVRCNGDEEGLFTTSRAAILELGPAAQADVLLTTAHGLPPDAAAVKRRCRVVAQGRMLRIADVMHAGGDLHGEAHDWAVLILEQRIAGSVRRWRPARTSPEWLAGAVAAGAPVQLVLRNDDQGQNDCRLELQHAQAPLLGHSCVAHPGLSGSPLVVALDAAAEPVLLAIHVGTGMFWQGTKLDFVRVARPIDAEVAAAIEAAARRTIVLASSAGRRLERRAAETRGLGQKQ